MAYVEVDEPIVLDSTGQDIKDSLDDIKSAVQGLGTALGSDRALIDGSNIANPSAFRSNIGCEWTSFTNAISDPNSNIEDITLKKCNSVVYISLTTKQKTFNENDVLLTITNSALIPTNTQRLVCWSYAADKCYTLSIKTNGVVDCYGRGSITGRLIFYGFYFTL